MWQEVVVLRTGATAAGCRRRPSHQPLWLSSTSLTSSICSLQKCLQPWASVQSRPAQSEPRDPRRRVDRRRTVQALQKALQQVRLCTLLPKAATFMESMREGPVSTNGAFSTGTLVSSQMRASPRWAHVTDVRVWRCWGDCPVLQHELPRTSCLLPSAATSGTSTSHVFFLKNGSGRSLKRGKIDWQGIKKEVFLKMCDDEGGGVVGWRRGAANKTQTWRNCSFQSKSFASTDAQALEVESFKLISKGFFFLISMNYWCEVKSAWDYTRRWWESAGLKENCKAKGYQMYVCVGRELPCAPVKFIKLWQHLITLNLWTWCWTRKIYFQLRSSGWV